MCGAPNLSPPSSRFPIAYIEVRVLSHATEDQEKVEMATRNTMPEKLAEEAKFTKTTCTGHYGNPITFLQTKLTDKEELPTALEKIASSLNSLDKEQLSREMKMHVEKHNLYLRFDKQRAFMGKLILASNDPIHFKIHFKNRSPEEITQICKNVGLVP